MEKYKNFIREAGIKVQNYKDLFENCSTDNEKVKKLSELLEERGVVLPPTLKKCRDAKKKWEKKSEADALDKSAIISEGTF